MMFRTALLMVASSFTCLVIDSTSEGSHTYRRFISPRLQFSLLGFRLLLRHFRHAWRDSRGRSSDMQVGRLKGSRYTNLGGRIDLGLLER